MAGRSYLTTNPKSRPASSNDLIVIALELFGVWMFTLLAGASNDAGTIMVILMTGLWLIFLIKHQSTVQNVGDIYSAFVSSTQQ